MNRLISAVLVIGLAASLLGCGGARGGVRRTLVLADARDKARPPLMMAESPSPSPSPEPRDPIGWITRSRLVGEASAGFEFGSVARDAEGILGANLRLGLRYSPFVSHISTPEGAIQDAVVGDAWGLDVRVRELWKIESGSQTPAWATAGIALVADNAIGDDNDESRLRMPSLLGAALPEIGVMISWGASNSLYMSQAFPLTVLVTRRLAIETRPSITIRFATESEPQPDAILTFSASLMVR
jgi:hypothetical protein